MIGAATAALLLVVAPDAVPWPGDALETVAGPVPRPFVVAADSAGEWGGPPESLALPPLPRPPLPDPLPFGVGEWLKFSIDYGVINAGAATMEIARVRRITGRECFEIRTNASSNTFFSKFYKVRDRAQSFVDVETVLPLRYDKRQREGGYKKDVLIKFDRRNSVARYDNGEEIITLPWAQDELSAFYYLRCLPLEVGRDVFIDNHTNRKNYPLKIIVHSRETVKVDAGTFDCFAIEPVIREGGIFKAKGTLTIWVTTDERRMPVKMRTKIVVGAITASLTEYRVGEPYSPAN